MSRTQRPNRPEGESLPSTSVNYMYYKYKQKQARTNPESVDTYIIPTVKVEVSDDNGAGQRPRCCKHAIRVAEEVAVTNRDVQLVLTIVEVATDDKWVVSLGI